jgi:hypothetical protein
LPSYCIGCDGAFWWLAAAAVVLLLTVPRLRVSYRFHESHVEHHDGATALAVAMHEMSGVASRERPVKIAHGVYPEANIFAPQFPTKCSWR